MSRVDDLLTREPPYRLLAIDGGGIRGMVAIEVLAGIEGMVQAELGASDEFVLADYFHYIGGTSTGAIIATCLSLGMRVDRIRRFYVEHGQTMFDKANLVRRIRYRFEGRRLTELIQQEFGADTTLGDERLRTLLMLVMRNASTNSPWPVSNNPRARYNRRDHLEGTSSNLDLKLWQLVRASTAAPTYFPPEVIQIGSRTAADSEERAEQGFIFVDGGLTTCNNPALQLFLMATADPYNLNWLPGAKQMLLVSVGTGQDPNINPSLVPRKMHLLYQAGAVPTAFASAAMQEQDFLCRVFGDCRHGDPLDREVGDMRGAGIGACDKLFTYVRYNAELSREGLDRLGLPDVEPRHVRRLDSVEHIAELREVGRAVARTVDREHFSGFLE
jgi:patatin-like phospholipase/acyl hydrolase